MKFNLLLIFLLQVSVISAQMFTPVSANEIFAGASGGSVAFSDIDNDGDEDVLMMGAPAMGQRLVKLYSNDGSGSFTEIENIPFEAIAYGEIAFSDIDNDGDEDVLMIGVLVTGNAIQKLYKNDGSGNFVEVLDTPFAAVGSGSIAFSDIDNDGDEDVLLVGQSTSGSYSNRAKLYKNDGLGNFMEVEDTPFEGVYGGEIAFSDIDNDGDEDVLIVGVKNIDERLAKLYENDGLGNFTEIEDTPFIGVLGSAAFSDIDNDGDEDVLITGEINSWGNEDISLYKNNGLGVFIKVLEHPFVSVKSDILFSDIDNDGDEDVLITGTHLSNRQANLYTNDGLGNFTEVLNSSFEKVGSSSIASADVDNDGDEDVFVMGSYIGSLGVSTLYINDGLGNFRDLRALPFFDAQSGDLAFSDVDGDGDEDVLITGRNNMSQQRSKLYLNDGYGDFSEVLNTPFDDVYLSSIAFSDIDNDGDEDLLITGAKTNYNSDRITKLYENDGLGVFTEVENIPFEGVSNGMVVFVDVDEDGDEDVLITGGNNIEEGVSKLYKNNGLGVFTEVLDTPFEEGKLSVVTCADIDGDGDKDILIAGVNNMDESFLKLYANEGATGFVELESQLFEGIKYNSVAFSDIDGDGDEDLLVTGRNDLYQSVSKLYVNGGTGVFTEVLDTPFEQSKFGSTVFSDVDGDGDEDVLITGENNSDEEISSLYINDGAGGFVESENELFERVKYSSIAFSDVDNDGDEDVLIIGYNSSYRAVSNLYINQNIVPTTDIITEHAHLKIFPNPISVGQELTINYNTEVAVVLEINVFDLNGRLLLKDRQLASIGSQVVTLQTSRLLSGTYIVQLSDGQRLSHAKLLVH